MTTCVTAVQAPLKPPGPRVRVPGSQSSLYVTTQLPARTHSGWSPGAWLWPGPTAAVVGIWEVLVWLPVKVTMGLTFVNPINNEWKIFRKTS